MPLIDKNVMNTDLFICVDEDFAYKYHARKLICKLRSVYNKENSFIIYNEYNSKAFTENEKYAN
jgi:hypothetical protein